MVEEFKFSRNSSCGRLKSNCSNTLEKFVIPEVERVTKLNFYNPDNTNTLDTLYKSRNQAKTMGMMNSSTFLKSSQLLRNNFKSKLDFEKDVKDIDKKRKCFSSADRMENIAFEVELENKRKKLDSKMSDKNYEKEQILKDLKDIDKKLNENKLKIQVLDNFDQYFDMNLRLRNTMEKEVPERRLRRIDSEKFVKLRNNFRVFSNDRDDENRKLKAESKTLLKAKEENLDLLKVIKEKKRKYKKELVGIKNELLVHYHALLNEGIDTRNEGLSWIIKAIWSLGYNVLMSYLPKYLDEDCILYLFNYSKRDTDAKKLIDRVQELKERLKADQIEQTIKSNKNIKFRNFRKQMDMRKSKHNIALETNNHDLILQSQTKILDEHLMERHIITVKNLNNLIETNNKFKIDDEALKCINEIKVLDKQLHELRNELNLMKQNELARINREFLMNDYKRRFNVSQETVISAIIGEDYAASELLRQVRDQKNYFKSVKFCKTFNFLEETGKKKTDIINELYWN